MQEDGRIHVDSADVCSNNGGVHQGTADACDKDGGIPVESGCMQHAGGAGPESRRNGKCTCGSAPADAGDAGRKSW